MRVCFFTRIAAIFLLLFFGSMTDDQAQAQMGQKSNICGDWNNYCQGGGSSSSGSGSGENIFHYWAEQRRLKIEEADRQRRQILNQAYQENQKCLDGKGSEKAARAQHHCQNALTLCSQAKGDCATDKWNIALNLARQADYADNPSATIRHARQALKYCSAERDCDNIRSWIASIERNVRLEKEYRERNLASERDLSSAQNRIERLNQQDDRSSASGLTFFDPRAEQRRVALSEERKTKISSVEAQLEAIRLDTGQRLMIELQTWEELKANEELNRAAASSQQAEDLANSSGADITRDLETNLEEAHCQASSSFDGNRCNGANGKPQVEEVPEVQGRAVSAADIAVEIKRLVYDMKVEPSPATAIEYWNVREEIDSIEIYRKDLAQVKKATKKDYAEKKITKKERDQVVSEIDSLTSKAKKLISEKTKDKKTLEKKYKTFKIDLPPKPKATPSPRNNQAQAQQQERT